MKEKVDGEGPEVNYILKYIGILSVGILGDCVSLLNNFTNFLKILQSYKLQSHM